MDEKQQFDGHRKTILLVDDESQVLQMVAMMLEARGYDVIPVNAFELAIQEVEYRRHNIDLLLTDVMMPGMNGVEMCERIHASYPELKCIYMSGLTPASIMFNGTIKEGVNFIRKPFGLKDLTKLIHRTLEPSLPE